MQTTYPHVEIFVTNSALCEQVIQLVQRVSGDQSRINVCDVRKESNAERAKILGLRSFPAIVVDDEVLPFDPVSAFSEMLGSVDWSQIFKAS
jgi:hypothetical protein